MQLFRVSWLLYFQASEDLENMETLAQMAASQNETNAADGETYIEKYIKGVSAVESILTLDRLRQVRELLPNIFISSN